MSRRVLTPSLRDVCPAYGATGSGKTHSMVGTPSSPGVMVQCVHDLFAAVAAQDTPDAFEINLSYLEVYNENLRDLLIDASPSLALNEDKNGMSVRGLTWKNDLKTAREVFELLKQGNARRSQCATDQNQQSSRSHAVLQIVVKKFDRLACAAAAASSSAAALVPPTELWTSKLSLIDLAGSERAAASTNKGSIQKEGAKINQSLLALGQVINGLVTKARNEASAKERTSRPGTAKKPATGAAAAAGSHIPFRASKLTRLLKDSLGGRCTTVMLAAVSPSSLSGEETHNTLKWADRAKQIKVDSRSNAPVGGKSLSAEEGRILREQLQQLLKEKSEGAWNKRSSPPRKRKSGGESDSTPQSVLAAYRTRITSLFHSKASIDADLSPLTTRAVQLTLLQNVYKRIAAEFVQLGSKHNPALQQLQAHISKLDVERHAVQTQSRSLRDSKLSAWNTQLHALRKEVDADAALNDDSRRLMKLEVDTRVQECTIREKDESISSYSSLVSQLTSYAHGSARSLFKLFKFTSLNASSSSIAQRLYEDAQGIVDESMRNLLSEGTLAESEEADKAAGRASFEPYVIEIASPTKKHNHKQNNHAQRHDVTEDEADVEARPIESAAATPSRPPISSGRYQFSAVPQIAFVAPAANNSMMPPPQPSPRRHPHRPAVDTLDDSMSPRSRTSYQEAARIAASLAPNTPQGGDGTRRISITPIVRNKLLAAQPSASPSNNGTPTRRPLPHNYAASPRVADSFSAAIHQMTTAPAEPDLKLLPQPSPAGKRLKGLNSSISAAPPALLGAPRVAPSWQSQIESEMAELDSMREDLSESHKLLPKTPGGVHHNRGHKRRSGGQQAAPIPVVQLTLPASIEPRETPPATAVSSSIPINRMQQLQSRTKMLSGGLPLHGRNGSVILAPIGGLSSVAHSRSSSALSGSNPLTQSTSTLVSRSNRPPLPKLLGSATISPKMRPLPSPSTLHDDPTENVAPTDVSMSSHRSFRPATAPLHVRTDSPQQPNQRTHVLPTSASSLLLSKPKLLGALSQHHVTHADLPPAAPQTSLIPKPSPSAKRTASALAGRPLSAHVQSPLRR